MLTTTEVIEKPLTPQQKIALDNQKVCEAFIQAYEAGDKQNALQYAKVVMLKAMCLWGFPQPVEIVENSKSQKVKKLTFLVFWKNEKSQKLKNWDFSVLLLFKL